jgi:alpha-N-arabinofuranosidase
MKFIHYLNWKWLLLILFCGQVTANTESARIELQLDSQHTHAPIQPTMYGLFFEDINFAADGGLYAELVKNRSFEFEEPMMGWSQPASDPYASNENSGIAHTLNYADNKTNKNVLRIKLYQGENYSLINEGFRGMGIRKGQSYNLSFYAANLDSSVKAIIFQLIDPKDQVIATTRVKPDAKDWQQYKTKLVAKKTEAKARLKISFEGKGTLDMDMISLFPADTWKGRPNGLRKDLVQMLADLKPGFLRFPGGCIIEGRTLAQRYQWKNTLGSAESRPTMVSRWNSEFKHRLTPDYFQSFGLGFYEYFQLAEDLGAEAIPVLNCGIACQFNSGELVPVTELDSYIQDALDLVEFANGSVDTPWGKVRADMGHPETFNLKYIGIGNEQWGPQYIERFKMFQDVLKKKHPEIILISGSGPFPDGPHFDYAHRELKKLNAEIIDEHYYKDIEWFTKNADRYDNYDRNGPKIFAGEYAAQSVATVSPDNKNSWMTALVEAAFMTGLERNADIVHLTSYAPLMAHTEAWQWSPNMIWFNNLDVLATANYQIQKLFSHNKGTNLLRITYESKPVTGQKGLFASAVKDKATKSVIIKLVNINSQTVDVKLVDKNLKKGKAEVTRLFAHPDTENSFEDPNAVKSVNKKLDIKMGEIELNLPGYSVSVIKAPLNKY